MYRSQVFDNSIQKSLRGVVTISLSVLPLFYAAHWLAMRAESQYAIGILYPVTFVFRNGETCQHIPIHTLDPQEFTHVCTSQSLGGHGPTQQPRACSSWPVPTPRYSAAANLFVPIASMGHMGFHFSGHGSVQPCQH